MTAPAATLGAAAAGLAVTLTILGTPYLVFGYHSPALHIMLNSVDASIAFLLSYLFFGRHRRSRRLGDLLLGQGLLLLGLGGLLVPLLLLVLDYFPPATGQVWLPLGMRVAASALVALAALVGERLTPARWAPWARWLPAVVGVGWLAGLLALRDVLPVALSQTAPASAERPVMSGHPLMLAAQAFTAVCFLVAAVVFALKARRHDDVLLTWLGPACALAGFARVNYVLFPSLYSDWVYTGDVLRTLSYSLLLVGATREIGRYWSAQSRLAVLDDRRRLARELHDGVVQELGYIRAEAHAISSDDALRQRILDAGDRALDEARAAVDALGHGSEESLGLVLQRAARQVAERYGAHVVLDLEDRVEADAEQRHALVRITREAVSNAIRHGRANAVHVRLDQDPAGRRLVVEDDGTGFDHDAGTQSTGYGLTSMRERAAALPGSFELRSGSGRGARVEVIW